MLDEPNVCSHFVLMPVETLGQAYSLSWRVHARCAKGRVDYTHSTCRCVFRTELDIQTLVMTRGPNFPLARLESRLICPRCGSRDIAVMFEPPAEKARA